MNNRFLILVLAVSCSAASIRPVILPSGEKGYSINCDNENLNACYEKAGEYCHHGYDIQIQTKDSGYTGSAGGYANAYVAGSSSKIQSTTEKGFIITCKEPEITETERSMVLRERAHEQKIKQENESHGFVLTLLAVAAIFSLGILTINITKP